MSDVRRQDGPFAGLGVWGSDISKWPPDEALAAREALLAQPDFRRVWEVERDFDRAIIAEREEIDREIVQSGALHRLRRRTMARIAGDPLAGIGWQRVAAAVLVAGMLGGAFDLVLPEPEPAELALVDALYGAGGPDAQ